MVLGRRKAIPKQAGAITLLDHDRGFGFILDDDNVERFFHASMVQNTEFEDLHVGERVTFTPLETSKGKRAIDVEAEGQVPVISPVSADEQGRAHNVNADSAAAAIAGAAACTDVIYLTDVPGVRAGGRILSRLSVPEARDLIAAKTIQGGMIAKMESAFDAVSLGVPRVHIGQWHGEKTLDELLAYQPGSGTTIHL